MSESNLYKTIMSLQQSIDIESIQNAHRPPMYLIGVVPYNKDTCSVDDESTTEL